MTGIVFGESPRWHGGRVWFADWGAHQVIALDPGGGHDVVATRAGRRTDHPRRPAPISDKPWNDIVVDTGGNAYVNSIGFDFPGGEPAPGE